VDDVDGAGGMTIETGEELVIQRHRSSVAIIA
jgi:hypothetical protein